MDATQENKKKVMRSTLKVLGFTMIALLAMTTATFAATNSNAPTITLTAKVDTSLTVSLSGNTQSWDSANATPNAMTPGAASNPGNAAITATTSWVLQPGHTAVKLYAYFASAANALTPAVGTTNIPSSAVEIKVGAGSFTPVSQDNTAAGMGVAGSSLLLKTIAITGANKVSSDASTLNFNINLSSLTQLPADTYTGTLTIQAQATP